MFFNPPCKIYCIGSECMKHILMMETGSFRTIGGAAKDTYMLYNKLRLRKGYDIDIFGSFNRIDKAAKTVDISELLAKDYDLIWMNSIRDVTIADTYRESHTNAKTRFLYVDRGNVLLNFSNASLKRLLPKMIARRHLISKMQKWLDYYIAINPGQYSFAKKFFDKRTEVHHILIAPHEEFRFLGKKRSFNGALAASRLDERQKKVSHMIKGIGAVVKGHKELKSEELLRIIGDGIDSERYKAMVHSLGLESNITFEGFFAGDELVKRYNNAAFFVSTSEWEGLGRSLLEAMACGLPLLINDNINTVIKDRPVTRVVKPGYNGLVYKYGNIDEFAAQFYKIYSDRELQKKLSANAQKFIRQFSFDKVVKSYERIIDGL